MFFSRKKPRHQEIEEEFNIMMTDARDSSAAVAAPGCLDASDPKFVVFFFSSWAVTQLRPERLFAVYRGWELYTTHFIWI